MRLPDLQPYVSKGEEISDDQLPPNQDDDSSLHQEQKLSSNEIVVKCEDLQDPDGKT